MCTGHQWCRCTPATAAHALVHLTYIKLVLTTDLFNRGIIIYDNIVNVARVCLVGSAPFGSLCRAFLSLGIHSSMVSFGGLVEVLDYNEEGGGKLRFKGPVC